MPPKRLHILQPLTSQPWQLTTVARRHFASSSEPKTNHQKRTKPSLYNRLFPKASTPQPSKASPLGNTTTATAAQNDDPEPPRISLHDDQELGEWLKQLQSTFADDTTTTTTTDKDPNAPTVLILSAPRDLLESDFYRVSPSGQHVQGWTSGPDKVIQHRTPHHLSPTEIFYLFFPSRPSALSYLSLLKTQHSLSRSALLSRLSSPPPPTPQSIPHSLIPPHIPTITSSIHPLSSLQTSFLTSTLPKTNQARLLPIPQPFSDVPQQAAGNFILLRLSNGKLTPRYLSHLIQNDDAPWGILPKTRKKGAITPLRATMSYVGLPESQNDNSTGDTGGKKKKGEEIKVYSRFLIGFDHPSEAKRFARCWHKKEVVDQVRGQRMVCNTTVLW